MLHFLLPPEVRSSWRIGYDMPEELQFAAYIGRAEDFTPPDTLVSVHSAPTEIEADWRAWWERLLVDNFGLRFERASAAMPDASFFEQARSVNPKETYDPPTFDALDASPTIQKLCRRHWSGFKDQWDASEQRWLIDLQQLANQRLNLNQIVYHCVKAAGKRISAPFRLRFDVVVWPAEYLRHISDEHAVIGAGYLAPERADDYRALHASYIARLV